METYKDKDGFYILKLKFSTIDGLNNIKKLINRVNKRVDDDEWFHFMTREYCYEHPDMPYKEAYDMIKQHYSQF